ncbi:hypothetical protein RvY_01456 [Ramazzottius varieornatus]|uniref:Uncharacterized protein n=1 Tax=Ramazzottius varieornatus TaxID=947166 RepID=A0A1D1UH97_RAMVA|nr:hypothetical protein RvY_01456 [Ramazzottius varieornatus]
MGARPNYHETSYDTGKENGSPPGYPGAPGPARGNVYYVPQQGAGVYPNAHGEVYVDSQQGNQAQPPVDPERPNNFGSSFDNAVIRRRFVRNVYSILMLQLLVTLGFICLFIFSPEVKRFVQHNSWFYYLSYAAFLVTYITLVCCPGVRRHHPTNIIVLAIFTLAMSYMTATISSFHDTKIVLMAIGICAAVCLVVSFSAAFCKFDMTKWGWILSLVLLVLLLFGFITLMFAYIPGLRSPWYHGIYSGLIALVFMGFLAYDTQLILGGRKYQTSPEEHISGALQLYLDVVYIFLGILGLSGFSSN